MRKEHQLLIDKAVQFFEESYLLTGLLPEQMTYLDGPSGDKRPVRACAVGAGGYRLDASIYDHDEYDPDAQSIKLEQVLIRHFTAIFGHQVKFWRRFLSGVIAGFDYAEIPDGHLDSSRKCGILVGIKVAQDMFSEATKEPTAKQRQKGAKVKA